MDVPGYDILEELGRGGMGVVYKARQIALDRLVALKMMLAGAYATPEETARFRIEAQAAARLDHANIVRIYHCDEHEGLPFFSMELISGGSLVPRIAGLAWHAPAAAHLMHTLALAIHHAHRHNIVHRDLKPSNVLLGADGTPKLTDFGLAKRLDQAGQTASGAVLGTPSYMAPEQAEGRGKEVGPAADVYALGAILYECLTGRPPFRAATPLETVMQVLTVEPVSPRLLQPGVPRDLDVICLKCLRKEPHKRYPNAWELAEDL